MHERIRVARRREEHAHHRAVARPAHRPSVQRQPLVVGRADDPAERAADRVADDALRRLGAAPSVVAPATTTRIARRATIGPEGGELDDVTARTLTAARGGGSPIDDSVRERLGAAMGADVGAVRLHAGTRAAELNDRIQASAFTVGRDVFFRDGLPDTGTREGMHLLAHEVAHTVQQGTSPVQRRVVRRKLVPKALDAFNAAEAANPQFATGRKNTDDLAAEADQEDLARVHGRGKVGKDSADERKVAHFLRAVVLSEYAKRLRALETAVNPDNSPLTAKQKAGKKAGYKERADEFRRMHTPLVEKGSRAPETMGFLREHGFAAAFGPALTAAPEQKARIDVRSTFIGARVLGKRVRAHLFIVYTAKDGRQMYFRGGPDDDDFTVADMGEYVPGATTDWDPSAPSVTLLEGPAAEAKLDALIEATGVIDGMKVPYQGAIAKEFGGANPNQAQELLTMAAMGLSSEGENCNATAWTILTRAGISKKSKPSGRHPGWGSILGSKTAGKENALPAAEGVSAVGKSYVVDDKKDVADDTGAVQVYRDRALFDPLTTVPTGTKVMIYKETVQWRQIGVNGKVGYIARRGEDAAYDLLPGWIDALRNNFTDDQIDDYLATPDDPAKRRAIGQATGIPRDYIIDAAQAAMHRDGDVAAMVWYRINQLGRPRAQEILDKPDELARLAANFGVQPDIVADTAKAIVGGVTNELKVPAILLKHLNDPNAANLAMNEAPDYPTLSAVATEMGVDIQWLARIVNGLRPTPNQNLYLAELLKADPLSESELPNVAGYMLTAWATQTGVPASFLDARCKLIHQQREADKARVAAEAKAKAEAEAAAKANAAKRKAKQQKAKAKKAKAKAPMGKGAAAKVVADAGPKVKLNESDSQKVFYGLINLGDDDAIWALVNDLPDRAALQQVAKDTGVPLADVIDVAMFFYKNHKGTIQLIDVVKGWPEEACREFAEGRSPEAAYTNVVTKVGLPKDVLIQRVAAYVAKKFG